MARCCCNGKARVASRSSNGDLRDRRRRVLLGVLADADGMSGWGAVAAGETGSVGRCSARRQVFGVAGLGGRVRGRCRYSRLAGTDAGCEMGAVTSRQIAIINEKLF
jgi:hypothetical protein